MSPAPAPPAVAALLLPDEAATARLGALLAQAIGQQHAAIVHDGMVIALAGDLGSGKTALVRAVLRALGVHGPVKSPTFALLEPYTVSRLNFYHFDFYRFASPAEFASAGFRELFGAGSICAIEWPERAGTCLPTPDVTVALSLAGDGRRALCTAATALGTTCLQIVTAAWVTPPAAS